MYWPGSFSRVQLHHLAAVSRPTASKVVPLVRGLSGFRPVKVLESIGFMERAMGIEPTSEVWDAISLLGFLFAASSHAATSRARLYRNGRTKVAVSVHCRPPQPID